MPLSTKERNVILASIKAVAKCLRGVCDKLDKMCDKLGITKPPTDREVTK